VQTAEHNIYKMSRTIDLKIVEIVILQLYWEGGIQKTVSAI